MTETVPTLPEGFCLHHFETLGSTNDEAKALARAGAPEGTLVWAGEQTAGRGRLGTRDISWISAAACNTPVVAPPSIVAC